MSQTAMSARPIPRVRFPKPCGNLAHIGHRLTGLEFTEMTNHIPDTLRSSESSNKNPISDRPLGLILAISRFDSHMNVTKTMIILYKLEKRNIVLSSAFEGLGSPNALSRDIDVTGAARNEWVSVNAVCR